MMSKRAVKSKSPNAGIAGKKRAMAMVGRSFPMKGHDQEAQDFAYWQTKTPGERLAEVTRLVRASLPEGARMDKTAWSIRKMHP
jgi:hypothetical protein